ncbi:MAG: hypothetical protein NTY87_00570 [Planctomycetia bacterium]|nr:hypothetical protein [Planctomycetia bacterium]
MSSDRSAVRRVLPSLIVAGLILLLAIVLARSDRAATGESVSLKRTIPSTPQSPTVAPSPPSVLPEVPSGPVSPPVTQPAPPSTPPLANPPPTPTLPQQGAPASLPGAVPPPQVPVMPNPPAGLPPALPALPPQGIPPGMPPLPGGVSTRGKYVESTTAPHASTVRRLDLSPPPVLQALAMRSGQSPSSGSSSDSGIGALPITLEVGKTLALENRVHATEVFFETRRINRANRAVENGARPTIEQVVRWAQMGRPRKLTSVELDPVTGEINWPYVLTDPIYDLRREPLDLRFRSRADSGSGFQFAEIGEIELQIGNLIDDLKTNMRRYPAGSYGSARTFLDSLLQESRLPVN